MKTCITSTTKKIQIFQRKWSHIQGQTKHLFNLEKEQSLRKKATEKVRGRKTKKRRKERRTETDEQRKRKEEEGETQRQEKAQELIKESNNKKHRKREHTWKRPDELHSNPTPVHLHFLLTYQLVPIPLTIPVLVLFIFLRMSLFPHFITFICVRTLPQSTAKF